MRRPRVDPVRWIRASVATRGRRLGGLAVLLVVLVTAGAMLWEPRQALGLTLVGVAVLGVAGALWAEFAQKPRGRSVSAAVAFGLTVASFYLALAQTPGEETSSAQPPAEMVRIAPPGSSGAAGPSVTVVEGGDFFQVAAGSGDDFADPVVADGGGRIRLRVRISNRGPLPLGDVRLLVHDSQPERTDATIWRAMLYSPRVDLSAVVDTATVNWGDNVSGTELLAGEVRVVDSSGRTLRRLGRGINQAGVALGTLEPGTPLLVEIPAKMLEPFRPPETPPMGSIEGGDILRGRIGHTGEFVDPLVADLGDIVNVRLRLHNGGGGPLSQVRVRVQGSRAPAATFAVVTALVTEDTITPVRDNVTISFAGEQRRRLRYVSGSTSIISRKHSPPCPADVEEQPAVDGVTQGGVIVPFVGTRDRPQGEYPDCSEIIQYVDFDMRVTS